MEDKTASSVRSKMFFATLTTWAFRIPALFVEGEKAEKLQKKN